MRFRLRGNLAVVSANDRAQGHALACARDAFRFSLDRSSPLGDWQQPCEGSHNRHQHPKHCCLAQNRRPLSDLLSVWTKCPKLESSPKNVLTERACGRAIFTYRHLGTALTLVEHFSSECPGPTEGTCPRGGHMRLEQPCIRVHDMLSHVFIAAPSEWRHPSARMRRSNSHW